MFSFASIRPRLAGWRGWLPLAALPLFMFAALLALGGDRGYLYRDHGLYNKNTLKALAIADNLSPEHSFRLAVRVWRDEDGGSEYDFYNRFPVGGYAILKLATLPFGNDLAAKLLAARVLMTLMFCGAALFACLAVARITGSRRVALAATPLAFSGLYAVYYADGVLTEGAMDMFGAALVLHGMAVFVQEGRFRQLLVKTCAALFIGWHVYALLLPFIAIGMGVEALALWRSALASNGKAKAALAAAVALTRSRCAALAAAAILFGSALVAFNLVNEYTAYAGERGFTRLDLFDSILRRFGLTDEYDERANAEWGNFIRRQLYRVGASSTPYSLARAVGYDFTADETVDLSLAPSFIGAAAVVAAVAALGALALARRRSGIAMASAVLFGFCWSIPLRYNTFSSAHVFESLPYTFMALALFALALLGARRLLGGRGGERFVLAVGAAAAVIFAASVFHAGRIERDDAEAKWDRSEMAEFSAILELARGKRVSIFPRHGYTRERLRENEYLRTAYYMSGSYWRMDDDPCDPRAADFTVSGYLHESVNPRAPDNRFAFVYEGASPLDLCRAARRELEASEPAARAVFDVYLKDGEVNYLKAPCEPNDYEAPFYLYAYPANSDDLPSEHRRGGFLPVEVPGGEPKRAAAAAFDDACLLTARPPDYPIAAIRTGQWIPGVERLWEAVIIPPPSAETLAFYEKAYQAIKSSGEPAARSDFDLYMDGDRNALSYLKEPCGENDAVGRREGEV